MSTLKLKIVFCFFLVLGSIVFGQDRKLILGEVVIKDNEIFFKEGIIILNENTNKTTKSDAKGKFSILAKEKDVLVFSSAEIAKKLNSHDQKNEQKLEIKINAKMLNRELKAHFILPQSNSEEVVVRPKYNLGRVIKTEKDLESMTNRNFGSENEKLSINPLNIIGFLSGNYKKQLRAQKRNQKFSETTTFINRTREYYGDDFFIKKLNLSTNQINHYLEFIAGSTDAKKLYKKKEYFSLEELLKIKAKAYLNIQKKPDSIKKP